MKGEKTGGEEYCRVFVFLLLEERESNRDKRKLKGGHRKGERQKQRKWDEVGSEREKGGGTGVEKSVLVNFDAVRMDVCHFGANWSSKTLVKRRSGVRRSVRFQPVLDDAGRALSLLHRLSSPARLLAPKVCSREVSR